MMEGGKGSDVAAKMPPQPAPEVQETTFAADASENSITYGDHDDDDAAPGNDNRNRHQVHGTFSTSEEGFLRARRPATGKKSSARAIAPDLLRGLLTVLMAMDHNSLALKSWPHGTGIVNEGDAHVVTHWNLPVAYVQRMFTHLCAPGFSFLLGMGVVYFGRSRQALSWSSMRMARHFLVRAVVLTLVTEVLGLALLGGQTWFFNAVLFALAVDYFLAGLLFLLMTRTERSLAFALVKILPDSPKDDALEPLLDDRRGEEDIAPDRKIIRAGDLSWHVHNIVLIALAVVTIWWNIWLSPTGGRCAPSGSESISSSSVTASPLTESIWFRLWFYPLEEAHAISGFPPLAWISFAIVGMLYARVVLARTWSRGAISMGNTLVGLGFLLIFVLTRILHLGNLSEGCLQLPEQAAHPGWNQYLASAKSFFYVTKYPPDVAFWAYTLGVNFLFLAFFGVVPTAVSSRFFKPLLVFGTCALFFYVVHLPVLFVTGGLLRKFFGHRTTGELECGIDEVWAVYLHWAVVLALLYPVCVWYSGFKSRKGPDSIWRFF